MRYLLWLYSAVVTVALLAALAFDDPKAWLRQKLSSAESASVGALPVAGRFLSQPEVQALLGKEQRAESESPMVYLLTQSPERDSRGRVVVSLRVHLQSPHLPRPQTLQLGAWGGYRLHSIRLPERASQELVAKLVASTPELSVVSLTVK